MTTDREEFEFLVGQVQQWAELDRLFGIGAAVLPSLGPLVSKASPSPPAGPPSAKAARLAELQKRLEGCTRCQLSAGRTNIVFG
ncbi:MAG: hypothetical protein ACAI25_04705, partial [Planctomycetota bacterium]